MTAATQQRAPSASTPPVPPAVVWKQLARLIAAPGRAQMRLYNAHTGKFSDTGRITESLPTRPAAVYLYAKGRTQQLVLDFDVKGHSAAQVTADLDTAASWITDCGGAVITDRSTNGGRHLICPLAIGTSASAEEVTELVRLLANRLPTLDITPATNPRTGCISVPGSLDKDGGHRQLDVPIEVAVEAFTTRSASDLLPRLHMLLGALKPPARQQARDSTPTISAADINTHLEGAGDDRRLAAAYRRFDPLPPEVEDFAAHGALSTHRPTWQSKHEARMSVIVNSIARGYSLTDLRDRVSPAGGWHDGLGSAYDRYHHRADLALTKDFTKALDWYVTNVVKSSPPRHKEKNYSPGGSRTGWRGPKNLRDWLANALAWADSEYAGKRCRWTVHAVLQCLAFYAHVAGEERGGSWLVGVGGRTLSLGCGLLSEDAVWRVLADLRDRPGAPLVLVRRAIGTEADVYALTSQNRVTADPSRSQRVRIEPVHEAWNVIGHHLRRVYELVAYHGLTNKADIFAAAAVPRATGDAMVTTLQIAGLLKKTGWGTVATGPTDLDAIAESQHLEELRQDRLRRHREERKAWRSWLEDRDQRQAASPGAAPLSPAQFDGLDSAEEHRAWQEAVLAHGPPGRDGIDQERDAIELIAELLGGRILCDQAQRSD
ncbi:hypothetical protein [Mycobacterium avium]|uniref:hypothetical protein n=1 Tax=Mycobacterium avium TaxID=1764 RepID=UPI000B4A9080|nr:hypothetical protein [Mycobacterium avium]